MRKLLIFLAGIILCAGCENYQADIDDYLSYWSTEAAIVRSSFNPAITVQTDTDTIQSIPSSRDVTVTFTVRNPKNVTFKLPQDAGAPTDIVVFPTDVAGTTTPTPKHPDDYELTQDSNSQLTLTYKKKFLQKHEYGKKNIGPTITLYADDGRKFSETFTLNIKANTTPSNLIYRAIGKTAAPDANGKYYYVLFLQAQDMDTEINGSALLHKDIAQVSIAEGDGSYVQVPLTVKEDKSGFDISGAGGRLLEAGATAQLALTDVESGVTPDTLPPSTEKWIIRIKTDVEVRGAVKQYRFRLQDEAGLFSEDELVASTSTNKVSPVLIAVQTGNWTTTTKSGSETDPHEIVYDPRVQKVVLQASTATTGATVEYKLERNSSVVSKSSGQTPQTIELPAVPDAVYKLTVWAEKEGYDKSSDVVVYYKTERNNTLEISTGQNAWKQLKAAVAAVEDGDVISINGTIKATNADGNNGAIEITKKVTIKGNDATIDMLDANKDELSTSAHRIFTIKNGGELILKKLTLKNGNAAGTSDQSRGGAMLIESGGTLTMTDCIVQKCIAANSGGGIDNKGILTINGGMVGSITAGGGNHASMGGGIFLDQGSCTLNGVAVQGNTIGTGIINRGSGIYLSKPSSGSAALTITGRTQIGDNTAGSNTLCLGARSSSQSAFVTAKDLDATAHINIEPHDYGAQKNTTLVKVPNDASAAAYKEYFHLTKDSAMAEGWLLIPDDDDEELILQKGKVIAGGGSGAWNRLKTAIAGAAAGDTIVIDGMIQATNATGNNGEIPINKSITIRGKSGNRTTDGLDANQAALGPNVHRIFNVTSSSTKLTLENITLQNGKAAGVGDNGMGGGIFCKNIKELTIKGCAIANCKADIEGGGICVAASSGVNTEAVITGTIISGNTAGLRGGGIAFDPSNVTLHITGVLDSVTVENNSLTSTDTDPNFNNGGAGIYFGGGYNDSSKYTVKGCTISGNNAGGYNGGGAYIKTNTSGSVNGTLTLTDGARISENSAENGGGIAVRSAKLIIEPGCTIGGEQDYNGTDPSKAKGNTAKTSGGGIYIGEKGECTTEENVAIRYNTVTNGITVMDGGGGLHIYGTSSPADSGTVTITGTQEKPVRIADNEARGSTGVGGGIANNGTITLTHVHISGCKAPDSGGLGGGIYVRRGACTLIDSNVNGCEASVAGGGMYVYKGADGAGEFTMQRSTRIVPSDDNIKGKNDIFLKNDYDDVYIKLSGKLTGARPVGRITVPDTKYNASTKVLHSDITVDENYKKFTVTPGGSPSQNWYVGSDGKLTTTEPSP
ncbi:hypothetical protein [Treponema sp. OMZ 855]|uniref:hypothetical protein n=1 Tax=Treponema sp. OMZ 855 TaxID=1643512 RepID=UPI0020A338AA|nr:hypothetical protein [Treponema sp. OMZ 855]UTC50233.1 hypothetical protein E4N65_09070 [Treponema sp. OMZ 855]